MLCADVRRTTDPKRTAGRFLRLKRAFPDRGVPEKSDGIMLRTKTRPTKEPVYLAGRVATKASARASQSSSTSSSSRTSPATATKPDMVLSPMVIGLAPGRARAAA